jgi:hypothetical protein
MIPIKKYERPTTGQGSASPRYELHTKCCGLLFAADDDLAKLERGADRHGVDIAKLVIYDLGAKIRGLL